MWYIEKGVRGEKAMQLIREKSEPRLRCYQAVLLPLFLFGTRIIRFAAINIVRALWGAWLSAVYYIYT